MLSCFTDCLFEVEEANILVRKSLGYDLWIATVRLFPRTAIGWTNQNPGFVPFVTG